jgi:hypothetical protein
MYYRERYGSTIYSLPGTGKKRDGFTNINKFEKKIRNDVYQYSPDQITELYEEQQKYPNLFWIEWEKKIVGLLNFDEFKSRYICDTQMDYRDCEEIQLKLKSEYNEQKCNPVAYWKKFQSIYGWKYYTLDEYAVKYTPLYRNHELFIGNYETQKLLAELSKKSIDEIKDFCHERTSIPDSLKSYGIRVRKNKYYCEYNSKVNPNFLKYEQWLEIHTMLFKEKSIFDFGENHEISKNDIIRKVEQMCHYNILHNRIYEVSENYSSNIREPIDILDRLKMMACNNKEEICCVIF